MRSCAAATTLLDSYSSWRIHSTLAPPVVRTDRGIRRHETDVRWLDRETAPPSPDWRQADFDDSHWVRGAIPRICSTPYLRCACLRGTFDVEEPRRVRSLAISLEFHGGAVVYLNDKEVGRNNLPPGTVTDRTLARDYPIEAFVKANGDLLTPQGTKLAHGRAGVPSDDDAQRMQSSVRQIGNLEIPVHLLRKGRNVLALEVIRAPYHKVMLDGERTGKERINTYDWNTCELIHVEVEVDGSRGVTSGRERTRGLQVWNSDLLQAITDQDRGNPLEPLRPVRIVGAGNGRFSGKLVVSDADSLSGLKATVSDLVGLGGRIPSSALQVRYTAPWGKQLGLTNDSEGFRTPYRKHATLLGMLTDEAEDNVSVVAIWVTVDVPPDAAPGPYSGAITIKANGEKEVRVPLELDVAAWALPDPKDYQTWVELTQVPDTLAVEYDLPLWSDRHFEMIARSFKLISDAGTRVVYIPLIAHTNLGNEESMVRWIEKGPEHYAFDFSIMDRYLDLAEEHLGSPRIVVLQAWDVYMATASQKRFEEFVQLGGPIVTMLDPASGQTENVNLPALDAKESKASWEALFQDVLTRLEKRGLREAAMLGMFPDMGPSMDDARFFKSVAPELAWVQQGHAIWQDLHGIGEIGYNASVWGGYRFSDGGRQTNQKGDPVVESLHGWDRDRLDVVFERNINLPDYPLSRWFFFAETGITSELRGVGRIGADYWKAVMDKRGRRRGYVHDRFTEGSWTGHSLNLSLCNPVLAPGEEGPEATTRLMVFKEGVQECEARIVIEKALISSTLKRKLGAQLALRCEAALDRRLLDMWRSLSNYRLGSQLFGARSWRWTPGIPGHNYFLGTGRQDRTKELFTLAGEVEMKLEEGKGTRQP